MLRPYSSYATSVSLDLHQVGIGIQCPLRDREHHPMDPRYRLGLPCLRENTEANQVDVASKDERVSAAVVQWPNRSEGIGKCLILLSFQDPRLDTRCWGHVGDIRRPPDVRWFEQIVERAQRDESVAAARRAVVVVQGPPECREISACPGSLSLDE